MLDGETEFEGELSLCVFTVHGDADGDVEPETRGEESFFGDGDKEVGEDSESEEVSIPFGTFDGVIGEALSGEGAAWAMFILCIFERPPGANHEVEGEGKEFPVITDVYSGGETCGCRGEFLVSRRNGFDGAKSWSDVEIEDAAIGFAIERGFLSRSGERKHQSPEEQCE